MPYKPKKWQATNIFIKANKEIDYEKIEAKKKLTYLQMSFLMKLMKKELRFLTKESLFIYSVWTQ